MKKIQVYFFVIMLCWFSGSGLVYAGTRVNDGKVIFGKTGAEWLWSMSAAGKDPNSNTVYGDTNFVFNNTTGNYNTLNGYGSLGNNSTGKYNCAYGWNAMIGYSESNSTIAIGPESVFLGGSDCVAVGDSTLKSQEPDCDNDNTALGYFAGSELKRGKKCLLIGFRADLGDPNISYAQCIGNECEVNTAKQMVIRSYNDIVFQDANSGTTVNTATIKGGMLGINTMSPTAYMDANAPSLRLRLTKTPATSSAAGYKGDICWDPNYVYVCTYIDPNGVVTWKRAALSTW